AAGAARIGAVSEAMYERTVKWGWVFLVSKAEDAGRPDGRSGASSARPRVSLSREVVMPEDAFSRRAALLSIGAFVTAGLGGCNTTPTSGVQPAASGLNIGAITVDTTPLIAYVGNPTAGWAQQALPGALAQVLGSGAPGGPPLHVRVNTLYLG